MKIILAALLVFIVFVVACTSEVQTEEKKPSTNAIKATSTSETVTSEEQGPGKEQFLIQECEGKSTAFDKETCYEYKAVRELKNVDYCQNAGRFRVPCINDFISMNPVPEYCEFKWLDKEEKENCYSLLALYSLDESYCEKAGSLKEECIQDVLAEK